MTYWSKTEFIAYSIYNDVITLPCIRSPCHKLAQNFGQNIESLQNHCDKFCENYSVNVSHVSHDDWRSGTVMLGDFVKNIFIFIVEIDFISK